MILNAEWEPQQNKVISKPYCKKAFVFGISKRNCYLTDALQEFCVEGFFDNNSELWGSCENDIPITIPRYVANAVVFVAIKKYVDVVLQLLELGYSQKNIYIFLEDEVYVKQKSCYLDLFSEQNFELKTTGNIKFVHVINDQKFVLPTLDAIEKYFDVKEHFFVIHSLGQSNEYDLYQTWKTCIDFQNKYKNIYFVDNYYNGWFVDWNEKLNELDEIIMSCKRIIFHGEWLSDEITEYFSEKQNVLQEKAIWIVWSGNLENDTQNFPYIQKMLRYVGAVVSNNQYIFDCIDEKFQMLSYKKIFSNFNYTTSGNEIIGKKEGNKVFIAHSCYSHDNTLEALELLYKFSEQIDIYCITSYGDEVAIAATKETGVKLYGSRFHAVDEFLEYKKYAELIADMDVAFFCQETGAGFGTLQLLFASRAKVYAKQGSNTVKNVTDYGYKVSYCEDIKNQNIESFFDDRYVEHNYKVASKNFEDCVIKKGWEDVLYSEI